ncbi:MAG: hypothetical protein WDN69_21505 [Aliidongia sp.]
MSDLLVQLAAYYECHDLALSSRKACVALRQCGPALGEWNAAPADFDRIGDGIEHVLVANGFSMKSRAPAFMPRTDIGTSPKLVIKITGRCAPSRANCS